MIKFLTIVQIHLCTLIMGIILPNLPRLLCKSEGNFIIVECPRQNLAYGRVENSINGMSPKGQWVEAKFFQNHVINYHTVNNLSYTSQSTLLVISASGTFVGIR